MNTPHRFARAGLFFCAVLFSLSARAADARVYVRHATNQRTAVEAALAQAAARQHHYFDSLNAFAVTIPDAARAALARNPAITLIEEDPVRGFLAESVPYGIPLVQADQVVNGGVTGAGIKVGVVDSGVFSGHADLASSIITGEPYLGGTNSRNWNRDYFSHGTHVVGTIAAVGNNGQGVVGVSPGAVSIHMVKVFGDTGGWIYSSDTLAAARAAAAKGARVVNMSLGGDRSSRTEDAGMAELYTRGVLLVAAAGNDGTSALNYPAGYDSVISVAAVDSSKVVASFSQQNADVELAAPGVAVLSTVSYTETLSVVAGASTFAAEQIEFAARGTATGELIYGGIGRPGNRAWSGKVVLIDRGQTTFEDKVRTAERSGAIACIIANNVEGEVDGTLGDGNSSTIPAVAVSQADGVTLQSKVGTSVTVTSLAQNDQSAYDEYDGTSMAAPHVSGVAALIWSAHRGATNVQVRQALTSTALELGSPGRDPAYGHGLVQAAAALTALAAMNPAPPPSDVTAPTIQNIAVTPGTGGLVQISWTTNEPASSDVELNGFAYLDPDPILATTHVRTFRLSRNATYVYRLTSTDAYGNSTTTVLATLSL